MKIEHAFTNFANPVMVCINHSTHPVYFYVLFHLCLPDIEGILQKICAFVHLSVTMRTVLPDLPIISFSQPPNLCHSLGQAKFCQPPGVIDEPPRPSQSCGKSYCRHC